MKATVLGAGGGLGRNVVEALLRAGHEVRALVRLKRGEPFAEGVEVLEGDARHLEDVLKALHGADVAYFCLNPRFSRWLVEFPPLLATAITAARETESRLVFPANVWIYGPGRPGELVNETAAASPTSQRGRLRAAMEQTLRAAGCRYALVRLPEFYGPHVVTLTAAVFRAALSGRRTLWPGSFDAEVEFIYLPDAAEAMVRVGSDQATDGEEFHLPGIPTTPREFIDRVYRTANAEPRALAVPNFVLNLAGLVNPTARAAADIAHLWSKPIHLDGLRYTNWFGPPPRTTYEQGIAETMAWHRSVPNLVLQG
jgi:nucleoside-diphosphate-sugar epimerase